MSPPVQFTIYHSTWITKQKNNVTSCNPILRTTNKTKPTRAKKTPTPQTNKLAKSNRPRTKEMDIPRDQDWRPYSRVKHDLSRKAIPAEGNLRRKNWIG